MPDPVKPDKNRYPVGSSLKPVLTASVNKSKSSKIGAYVQAVTEEFGGQEIACNRRVAQMGCFNLRSAYGVSEEDAAAVAEALCGYIESGQCLKK